MMVTTYGVYSYNSSLLKWSFVARERFYDFTMVIFSWFIACYTNPIKYSLEIELFWMHIAVLLDFCLEESG